ncbi:single-stranded DNA-binding protein [Aerococcaceae bacterium DSM 111020]|nr:single-stranded DNA-binding protein [Aerococcaceae bacterium DSM 111020]
MNTVQLVGRLTKDIELKYTQSGKPFTSFVVAVDRSFKNENGEREADFPMCQAWGKTAELMETYTNKGSRVGLEGSIRTRSYDNDQGTRIYVTEINVDRIHFLDNKQDNQQQGQQPQQPQQQFNQPQGQNNGYQQQNQSFNPNYGQNNNYQQPVNGGQDVDIAPDDLPF